MHNGHTPEARRSRKERMAASSSSSRRFEGKVVVVTGGGAGIGAAICRRFYQEGAQVYVADVNATGAADTVRQIHDVDAKGQAEWDRAHKYVVDLSDEAQVSAMFEAVMKTHGRLDVLVNNAARFVLKTAEAASAEDWDAVFAANVKGMGLATKYAIKAMRASPGAPSTQDGAKGRPAGGAIVNLGSISSFIGQGGICTYSTTKAAVLALTRCTAIDCGPYGIRVNAVCPGPILTDATRKHADSCGKSVDDMVAEMTGHMVQHRMGEPAEVAAAVAFMASSDASFITGASLMVDGGYTAI